MRRQSPVQSASRFYNLFCSARRWVDSCTIRYADLKREQSRGEEIANSISHGIGLAAALAATPFLLSQAMRHGAGMLIGNAIFAATVVLLYSASTLYHALSPGRAKRMFRVMEHSAIFLLIAGTYTPFTLGVLAGPWGRTLLVLVWGLAVVGVVLKSCNRGLTPITSTGLYLLMGWLVMMSPTQLLARLPLPGLVWLAVGGLAYTVGVIFYANDSRFRFSHFVWHLFVMAGTVCHYLAVLWYAAG